MNFLALVQRVAIECGVANAPAAVAGQRGEAARLVAWTNEAWKDIQVAHQDWDWMRKSASVATVAGQGSYTPTDFALTDFGKWHPDTFRNYVTASGVVTEILMTPIEYEDWRDSYNFGANRLVQTRPIAFAISPAKAVCLAPFPAAGYTITADYFSAPSDLAADADVPALPDHFHMAIVYRAMMYYGQFEVAAEVLQRGATEFDKLMRRMDADRLPSVDFCGAL